MNHDEYIKQRNAMIQEHTDLREYRDIDFDELAQAIDALVLQVIGDNDPSTSVNKNYRNELRAEQRKTVQGGQ